MKDVEDAIFRLKDALNRSRGKYEERLKFTQMQQAHNGIDVRRSEKYAADRGTG